MEIKHRGSQRFMNRKAVLLSVLSVTPQNWNINYAT
jgi:hypothetical protein